eukprot:760343-Hanusia_phi.AAC.4
MQGPEVGPAAGGKANGMIRTTRAGGDSESAQSASGTEPPSDRAASRLPLVSEGWLAHHHTTFILILKKQQGHAGLASSTALEIDTLDVSSTGTPHEKDHNTSRQSASRSE